MARNRRSKTYVVPVKMRTLNNCVDDSLIDENVNANVGINNGLGDFYSYIGVCDAFSHIAFLGCANKEIAKHLGKYFGMLITEAKYGDMVDFKIIDDKYNI